MIDIFKRNTTVKLLSLLLALILWLYVGNQQNPYSDQVFNNVPLEIENLPSDMAVVEIPKSVSIRVQGTKGLVNTLSAVDVKAWVDLKDCGVGSNFFDVKVQVPQSVRLIKVEPGRVSGKLDVIDSRQIDVQVDVSGTPKENYEVYSPVVSPTQVVLKGPKGLLENVSQVIARVDVNGMEANSNQKIVLTALNRSGREIDSRTIHIEPNIIDVFVPVLPSQPHKNVRILPRITGKPATGYRIADIVVDRKEVTVIGDKEQLESLTSLSTEEVNIEGANNDIVKEVRLVGLDEVSWIGPSSVKVIVRIEATSLTEQTEPIDLQLKGQAKDKVTVQNQNVNVTWQSVDGEKPKAWIDISELEVGEHQVTVETQISNGKIIAVSPQEVKVVVGEPEEIEVIQPPNSTEVH